ncbi:MAG: hypothetical protein OES25_15450 [Acidobacteriota bacterium]|nr:hypothetical protein [Acidobacteriota bacterium]
MKRHLNRPLVVLLSIVLAVTLTPFAAEGEKAKSQEKTKKGSDIARATGGKKVDKKKADDAPIVFTNADLKSTPKKAATDDPSSETATPTTPTTPPPTTPTTKQPAAPGLPDPLAAMKAKKAADAERQQQIAAAEEAVVAAEQKITGLEKRLLATRNPYLPRPDAPDGDETWNAADGQERVRRTQKSLEDARTELVEARKALAESRSK